MQLKYSIQIGSLDLELQRKLFGSTILSGRASTKKTTMVDTGRQHDIMELYRLLDSERNPERRTAIMHSIRCVRNESGLIRSMREALVKAHKNGDKWEIKDIHDYIKNKQKYQNG